MTTQTAALLLTLVLLAGCAMIIERARIGSAIHQCACPCVPAESTPDASRESDRR